MDEPIRLRRAGARVLGSAALALAALVTVSHGPAHAICAASLDPVYVQSVLDDPRSLLRLNPRGGETLVLTIRQLAVNGTRLLKGIATIVPQANPQQKAAIGKGLASANGACSARSPEIAQQISDLVRASTDREVTRAYTRFFSATESSPIGSNTTSTMGPQSSGERRTPNLDSRFGPRSLPLGDPFAKP